MMHSLAEEGLLKSLSLLPCLVYHKYSELPQIAQTGKQVIASMHVSRVCVFSCLGKRPRRIAAPPRDRLAM